MGAASIVQGLSGLENQQCTLAYHKTVFCLKAELFSGPFSKPSGFSCGHINVVKPDFWRVRVLGHFKQCSLAKVYLQTKQELNRN